PNLRAERPTAKRPPTKRPPNRLHGEVPARGNPVSSSDAYRTCPICDAVCGLRLTLGENGRVLAVNGDAADPFSQGYICPKGASLGVIDEDPDRLSVPMVRKDGEWREVSWEEAFQEVHRGLRSVIETHGQDAVAVYFGNPTFHTMAGFMYRMPLTQTLATR